MGLPDRPNASPFSPAYSRRLFCLGGPEQAATKATSVSHRSAFKKRQARNSKGIGWAGGYHCLTGGSATAVDGRCGCAFYRWLGWWCLTDGEGERGEERPLRFLSAPTVGGCCRLRGRGGGNGRFGFSQCRPWADGGLVEKAWAGGNGRWPCAVISCPISRSRVQLTPWMRDSYNRRRE